MLEHAGSIDTKSHKLVIVVFTLSSPFSKYKFVVDFSNAICTKRRANFPTSPTFIYEN